MKHPSILRSLPLSTELSLLVVGAFALTLLASGCGSSYGKLHSEEVLAAIESAQQSVEQAQNTELSVSAAPSLDRAERRLLDAQRAYHQKKGYDALRAAQEAEFEARQALSLDAQADTFSKVLTDEVERYHALARQLETAKQDAEDARDEMIPIRQELQTLSVRLLEVENTYREELRRMASEKEASDERAKKARLELTATQERMSTLNNLLEDARDRQKSAERRVGELTNQVEAASSAIESAKTTANRQAAKQVAQAQAETETVKKQAKELASAYSERMEDLERKNARDSALAKARQDAQNRNAPSNVPVTDIQDAKSSVTAWKQAWSGRNTAAHLGYYSSSARGERVTVVKGKETRSALSHSELVSQLRSMGSQSWEELSQQSSLSAEGDSVTAQAAYRRKGGSDALDFWVRKSYWKRVGDDWRIVRETWRLYDDVPTFSRR